MQEEHVGTKALDAISIILDRCGAKRIFLVTGKSVYESSGVSRLLGTTLAGREVFRFSDFTSNPKLEEVDVAVTALRNFSPDIVLAVGGGSALDIAKSAAALSIQNCPLESYVKNEKTLSTGWPPIIAVPTTAGTGSEATHFAVVYIDSKKYSLEHPAMIPAYSIIDPVLLSSVGPTLAATTGMDALCQAIESYWSVLSTDESKEYARQAILLIKRNIVAMVRARTRESCLAMARGAHLAGKAINISKTTASHALSYPITSHAGVAHGHAVALTLPSVIRFNAQVGEKDVSDSRGLSYVHAILTDINQLFDAKNAEDTAQKIEDLMDQIGLARRLSSFGVNTQDIPSFMGEISRVRLANNPRQMTETDAERILIGIL